ncbi:uncharacterized protein LOC136092997 [Hydra vulgaris]|uniref:uncharacterized protein LOC136092997 n=1 Tax=Hydra vulgaris TaxID=6087 RepID=UPI0032E9FBAF
MQNVHSSCLDRKYREIMRENSIDNFLCCSLSLNVINCFNEMHKPHLTNTDLSCSKFNVMEIMLTNFLKLEVKPLRQIQIHVMQRLTNFLKLEVKPLRQIQIHVMQRQMFLIILSALGVFLRLEGGLLGPNSSPV